MTEAMAELQQLAVLLKLEKQKDFEQFQAFVQSLSLQERVAEGYSWYPVLVDKSGYTYGERAFVTVSRTKESHVQHQFRAGQPVRLFTNGAVEKKPEKSGVIHSITKGRMKIILGSKDLPDWLNLGSLGVDLEFDERTYLEMERALKKVQEARGDRLAELRSILLGVHKPSFTDIPLVQIPKLNESQNSAVQQILSARDVAVVHGPPGTGKTTTLVQAIRLICKTENTVLVCAPSNAAADLLTERLAEEGLQVLRIGNISRVEEKNRPAHPGSADCRPPGEQKHQEGAPGSRRDPPPGHAVQTPLRAGRTAGEKPSLQAGRRAVWLGQSAGRSTGGKYPGQRTGNHLHTGWFSTQSARQPDFPHRGD